MIKVRRYLDRSRNILRTNEYSEKLTKKAPSPASFLYAKLTNRRRLFINDYIRILDANRRPIAVLENAYAVGYERPLNEIWTANFALPLDDPKNAHCKPFNYVDIPDIGLFRIIPAKTRKLATINEVQYECEHVLSTLLNDVLFRYHQRSNFTTRENIEYILSQQTTKHWRFGDCDFTRYFHYKWENENGLLGALFSIVEPFDEPYEFTWDTTEYPWTLNLVKPSEQPTAEVRFGKNLADIEREIDPSNIVNRLYPLGAGEGVNQLDITRVNNGVEFIENQASINEYGLQSYVWVDRRFEDEESLLASARKFLDEWSKPKASYTIKAIDLSSLTGLSIDKLTVGKMIRVTDPEIGTFNARIVNEHKAELIEAPYDIELTLTNAVETVGATLADVERKQEINEVYAQGATNVLTFGYQDNADGNVPAVIPFYIDDDVVNVNTCELTFRLKPFRAYSRATEGGGSIVKSTSSGGATVKSNSSGGGTTRSTTSGGGTSRSTNSGGATTRSSSSGGNHHHVLFVDNGDSSGELPYRSLHYDDGGQGSTIQVRKAGSANIRTYSASGDHTHSVSIPSHTHEFTVPAHSHEVVIPSHTHEIDIPNHSHEIDLPDHTHKVKHEIIELNTLPSKVTIKINDNTIPFSDIEGDRVDITPFLPKVDQGKIIRGRHELSILPNGLARIEADLILRVFIQSHLGGVY